MNEKLVILCWSNGDRSYTSSRVLERYEALYGPMRGLVVRRTSHPWQQDAIGTAILPAGVS